MLATVQLVKPGVYEIQVPDMLHSYTIFINYQDLLAFRGSINEAVVHYAETYLEAKLNQELKVILMENKDEQRRTK